MAGDLGLLSLTRLHKLAHQHPNPNPGSWAWNARRTASNDDDDSWEVRAFAEDTGNIMGTTWPPRSYTCTFCRREFRSAQALGGHMNVHRRDRARLHHAPATVSEPSSTTTATTTSTPLICPTQEFITSGGLCLFYPFPPHGSVYTPTSANGCLDSPSTILSIAPNSSNNAISSTSPSCTFPGIFDSSICHSRKGETKVPVYSSNNDNNTSNKNEDGDDDNDDNNHHKEPIVEELDLELRLGRRPPRH